MTLERVPSVVILCLAALIGMATAQTVTLPKTEGKTLADKPLVVADAIKGQGTVLFITFSRRAGQKAYGWRKALRDKKIPNPNYGLYQLAALEDVPRLIRWSVVSGIRRGIPPEERSSFVILTKDTAQWKQFVSFKTDDDPYIVVVDASGKIKARLVGESTPARVEELAQQLK